MILYLRNKKKRKKKEKLKYNIQRRWAFQVALVVKNSPANAGNVRDSGSIPGWGRSPREGNGNPLQYPCLENLMDRGSLRSMGSQRIGHD